MRWCLPLLLACGSASAGNADDILARARHAQLVLGDLTAARSLYREVLQDKSLDPALQAEIHLRLALCYYESDLLREAKGHLAKGLFEREGVPESVRFRAADLRDRITLDEPKKVKPAPTREDPAVQKAKLLKEAKRRARRFLRQNDVAQASYHIQSALEMAPDDADVRALAAELETRLSGVMDFLSAPLQFVSRWTASRTRAVAKEAQNLLRQALIQTSKRHFNLAERFFREAITAIDSCEFGADSDELIGLRLNIRERWRDMRLQHLGPDRADPVGPAKPRRATLLSGYLNHLQRMLDLLSSPDREYRIVPVASRRAPSTTRGHTVPEIYTLFDHLPSQWTPARFASLYLPLRIYPDSWKKRGNYLEAAGGMLIARNRPEVLDLLQKAVRRIEQPEFGTVHARFILVSVPRATLDGFAERFGAFSVAERGESPLQFRVVPEKHSLNYLCSYLRDEGADVKSERDTFDVELSNGVAQTLFVGVPLDRAPGYSTFKAAGAPVSATHYGLHLDTFSLRERDGRTAMALRVTARFPAAPVSTGARFLSQAGELFADLPPGATLVVGGLIDPFAAGSGKGERELLLLWKNPPLAGRPPALAGPEQELGVEIPLRNLLLKVHDRPGPRADPDKGFVRRERSEVRRTRARFLESLLREGLRSQAVHINVEEAVVRVPPLLREKATALVGQLEKESARSYVVRVQTRSVRTRVFERWMKHEKLSLAPFGAASVAMRDQADAEFMLRRLGEGTPDDVFAPLRAWPAVTVLGLQAGHALHVRTRTSPRYTTDEDLATGESRTVTEGTRVTVRPYVWGNRLRAWVEVELAGLESEVEELTLSRAVPSYRTSVAAMHVNGLLDCGQATKPYTLFICRIPHPTASSPETLTEIVIVISIRPVR